MIYITLAFTCQICIPRVEYGFTLRGCNPTRVGRIRWYGTAERAGLRSGDHVMAINAITALDLSATSLATIVRFAITMCV